jgi:hypothetical protein
MEIGNLKPLFRNQLLKDRFSERLLKSGYLRNRVSETTHAENHGLENPVLGNNVLKTK